MDHELPWHVYDINSRKIAAFSDGFSWLAMDIINERMRSGSLFRDGEFHFSLGLEAITKLPIIQGTPDELAANRNGSV